MGAVGDGNAWFNRVQERYSENHRHYHNAEHIAECLSELESLKVVGEPDLALELAVWLHDVIYDPHRSDNEDQSIQFAEKLLVDAGVSKDITAKVGRLIDVTRHSGTPDDQLERWMVDIDLAILGREPKRFWRYEEAIRAEYDFVPETIFHAKRTEILEGFLQRTSIYHCKVFHDRYERQARENLAASVAKLRDTHWPA